MACFGQSRAKKFGTIILLLGMLAFLFPETGTAQRWDPDWHLLARDSRDHFLAGGGISAAARLIFPKAHGWQRLAVVATVALSYELGQEGVARNSGLQGPGFGLSPKDFLCTVAGGLLFEVIWNISHRTPGADDG